MLVNQVLFGYQDGHRQLAGSAQLNRDAASLLLGATDAVVGFEQDRLLTGLPLSAAGPYALSATWAAPEAGRPGAVWAHTLLVQFEDLTELVQPACLLKYLHRPQGSDFEGYNQPIRVDPTSTRPASPNLKLMKELLAVGVDQRRPRVVVHPDLHAAEETLLALWGAQWPALRVSFAFRTRDTMRAAPNASHVAVARRIRGMSQPGSQREAARNTQSHWLPGPDFPLWLSQLGGDPRGEGTLRRFLLLFGPDEVPELRSFVFLGELYESVAREDSRAVVTQLEKTHRGPRKANQLKVALFGERAENWWNITELELVAAVLETRKSVFDPKSLNLIHRLQVLIRSGFVTDLVAARARGGPKAVRGTLLEALSREATAETVIAVELLDRELALDLLREREDLASDPEVWVAMLPEQAQATLSQLELTTSIAVAAARAAQFQALLPSVPFPQLVEQLADAGELDLVRRAAEALPIEARSAEQSRDRVPLLLAAAGVPPSDLSDLLHALEQSRKAPDEIWFRGAVLALESAKRRELRDTLQVVFGPLHHAITDNRLPDDLWSSLDRLLPQAKNPALRLRRFLISRAKDEEWSALELERALRDSGPNINQLRSEVVNKELLGKLIKLGLKPLGRLRP